MSVRTALRALLIAALAAAAACSTPPQQRDVSETHWLRVADGAGAVPTLNPHLFNGTTVHLIAQLTMAYLFRYDAQGRPQPELATELPTQKNHGISADGRTITFHLRHGVRWSDGAPFTADDVAFTTRVILDPANHELTREGWDLITRIDEPDKYTVVYHLKRPYALFEPLFFGAGAASPCILPKHVLGKEPNINHVAYNTKPIGIGPFRVVRWRPDESVDLEANPYYWRGLPRLHRITFRFLPTREALLEAMQSGDVDLWPGIPPTYVAKVQAIRALRTIVRPADFWSALFFNVTRGPIADVRVRRAIRLAIDRPAIVATTLGGNGILEEAVLSPTVPVVPRDIPMVRFDPARARGLLESAGWALGPDGVRVKDGRRLTLALAIRAGPSLEPAAQLIKKNLSDVGIGVQIRRYSGARMFASYGDHGVVMRGNWDMTMFAWDSDPNGSLENVFACNRIPPAGQNITRFCDPELDLKLWRFTMTYDEDGRRLLEKQIQREIDAQVPVVTLFAWKQGYASSPQLEHYRPGSMAPFGNIMKLDI